ncbi:hypothetical protein IWQ60_001981 [Tieghemiomyces parasiticus]|uniref:NECAP PHear domain-containing protein n=1 Tax=Tieghemiomyces parasiticus TaxID=78921 RepID=A0A9W8ADJ7_9FUNG|nr:hypothetical protein IWQ60_004684 [Tieghemiomyces parasiticus]KAJ1928507.1 hypothetical protein IWQ60_001981 [Tieghemiomyces parasiticus]
MLNDNDYESVLLIVRECYVYKLPPRTRTAGYRAADWNVEEPLWKGRLRVMASTEKCVIRLEDNQTGELFAACNYDKTGSSVEPVLDSSRYFVLKIEDEAGRHAYIGLGFLDRTESFDFNVALQDFKRQGTNEEEEKAKVEAPKVDYSLKEGQTISINIGGLGKKPRPKPNTSAGQAGGAFPFLPPPPGGQRK